MMDGERRFTVDLSTERALLHYLCPFLDTDRLSDIEVVQILVEMEVGAYESGTGRIRRNSTGPSRNRRHSASTERISGSFSTRSWSAAKDSSES